MDWLYKKNIFFPQRFIIVEPRFYWMFWRAKYRRCVLHEKILHFLETFRHFSYIPSRWKPAVKLVIWTCRKTINVALLCTRSCDLFCIMSGAILLHNQRIGQSSWFERTAKKKSVYSCHLRAIKKETLVRREFSSENCKSRYCLLIKKNFKKNCHFRWWMIWTVYFISKNRHFMIAIRTGYDEETNRSPFIYTLYGPETVQFIFTGWKLKSLFSHTFLY